MKKHKRKGYLLAGVFVIVGIALFAYLSHMLYLRLAQTEGLDAGQILSAETETEEVESKGNQSPSDETHADPPETGSEDKSNDRLQTKAAPDEDPVQPEVSEPEVTSGAELAFVGDILLSEGVLSGYDRDGIDGIISNSVANVLREADLFFANQEFPFTSRGQQAPDKQFTFRVPTSRISILRKMGIDGVTLANNHALDYGTEGLVDSLDTLKEAEIASVGAGKDLEEAKNIWYKEAGGIRFAFLGATRVIPVVEWNAGENTPGMLTTYDPTALTALIRKAEKQADVVIVYVHWGIERKETPEAYQRELAKQYIDAGADLVVGSHPHCLQGIEYYKGVPVVYSLGNFIFGESIPKTAILKVHVDKDAHLSLSLIPCQAMGYRTEEILDPGKKKEFFQYIEDISFQVSISDSGELCQE